MVERLCQTCEEPTDNRHVCSVDCARVAVQIRRAVRAVMKDTPTRTFNLSGHFSNTEAARMIHRVEAQEAEGPRPTA